MEQGKEITKYLLDKDYFILIIMHSTGYNNFKMEYIKDSTKLKKLHKMIFL